MSGRKPTLGFASRTEAVLALRARQLSTDKIAAAIGISPKTVDALERSARRTIGRATGNRTVLMPVDVLERLLPHAQRRGLTINELCRRIVEACVDDNMIDAVLDDGEEIAAHEERATT